MRKRSGIGFSRAVRAGAFLAVAGTAPIAPDGGVAAPGDACRYLSLGASGARMVRSSRALKQACTFIEVKGVINREGFVELEVDCVATADA